MSDTAHTKGIHHLGLTVPDLGAATSFFLETLGFDQVGEKPDYPAVFVSDGTVMVTLWQAKDPTSAVPFDRKTNIGLHHFALRVESPERLDALHERVRGHPDVVTEFGPEPLGDGPTKHMMVTIPGGIRMEVIAPVGEQGAD